MLFYVRYRADRRKKNSSTFMMTYSLFPWRRRCSCSNVGFDNAVDGSRGVKRGVSNTAVTALSSTARWQPKTLRENSHDVLSLHNEEI